MHRKTKSCWTIQQFIMTKYYKWYCLRSMYLWLSMMLPMVGTVVFFLGFGSSTGTSIQCYCRKPRTHAPLRDVLLVRNYKKERGRCISIYIFASFWIWNETRNGSYLEEEVLCVMLLIKTVDGVSAHYMCTVCVCRKSHGRTNFSTHSKGPTLLLGRRFIQAEVHHNCFAIA